MGTSWMCRWWWWWRRRLKPLKGRMRWRWLYMILHNLHYRVSMHRLIFTHKQHFDLENTNLSSTFLLYFSFFFMCYILYYVICSTFFLLYFFAFYINMKEDDYFTILFISPVILGLYFKSMFLLYYIFFIFIFILELHYLYLYITCLMST